MAAVRTAGRHLNTGQWPGLLASPVPAGWWDSTPGSRCTPPGEDGPPGLKQPSHQRRQQQAGGHVNPSSARPGTLISREPPGSEPRTQWALEDPGNFDSPVPTGSPAHSESEIPKVAQTWNSPGLAGLLAVDSVWFCKPQGTPKPHLYPGSISSAPENHLFIRRTKQEGKTAILLPLARPVSGAERDVCR